MFCNIEHKVAMFLPVQYAAMYSASLTFQNVSRHKSIYHYVAGPCSARSSRPRVKHLLTSLCHPLHTLHYLRMMCLFLAFIFFDFVRIYLRAHALYHEHAQHTTHNTHTHTRHTVVRMQSPAASRLLLNVLACRREAAGDRSERLAFLFHSINRPDALEKAFVQCRGKGQGGVGLGRGQGGGVGGGGGGGGGGGEAEADLNVCGESCEAEEVVGLEGCFKLRGCAASTVYFVSVVVCVCVGLRLSLYLSRGCHVTRASKLPTQTPGVSSVCICLCFCRTCRCSHCLCFSLTCL